MKNYDVGFINIEDLPKVTSLDTVEYLLILNNDNLTQLLDSTVFLLNRKLYYTKSEINILLSKYIKLDGSTPLTNHWYLGDYRIRTLPALQDNEPITLGQLKDVLKNPYLVNPSWDMFKGVHDDDLVKKKDFDIKVSPGIREIIFLTRFQLDIFWPHGFFGYDFKVRPIEKHEQVYLNAIKDIENIEYYRDGYKLRFENGKFILDGALVITDLGFLKYINQIHNFDRRIFDIYGAKRLGIFVRVRDCFIVFMVFQAIGDGDYYFIIFAGLNQFINRFDSGVYIHHHGRLQVIAGTRFPVYLGCITYQYHNDFVPYTNLEDHHRELAYHRIDAGKIPYTIMLFNLIFCNDPPLINRIGDWFMHLLPNSHKVQTNKDFLFTGVYIHDVNHFTKMVIRNRLGVPSILDEKNSKLIHNRMLINVLNIEWRTFNPDKNKIDSYLTTVANTTGRGMGMIAYTWSNGQPFVTISIIEDDVTYNVEVPNYQIPNLP